MIEYLLLKPYLIMQTYPKPKFLLNLGFIFCNSSHSCRERIYIHLGPKDLEFRLFANSIDMF